MASALTLSVSLLSVIRLSSASFHISSLTTHQPNGTTYIPDLMERDPYRIDFNVTSDNLNSTGETVHCGAYWEDNLDFSIDVSEEVPTYNWLPCDTSEYQFHLYQDFTIGDFNLSLKQITQDNSVQTSFKSRVSNATFDAGSNDFDDMVCTIHTTTDFNAHTSGDCDSGDLSFYIDVETTSSVCDDPDYANVSFTVSVPTKWQDHVFVVGNIAQLGNWDPYNALALSGDGWTADSPLWNGGALALPVDFVFHYKYIVWTANGTLVWECGDDRQYMLEALDSTTCGAQVPADTGLDQFNCPDALA